MNKITMNQKDRQEYPPGNDHAMQWLQRLHELELQGQDIRILNVCGGHERVIALSGLRRALPPQISLIPGPGCPVCICPEEDVHKAIALALHHDITLVTFGDMLRVPINIPRARPRSLEQAKSLGADIRAIASPMEAIQIARRYPDREVVFFAVGFETTMAPIAAMLLSQPPPNLSVLLSGRLTWPAIALLLEDKQPGFNALIAPGHVATVMGANEWRFVVDRHHLPTAIAGFNNSSLLAAIYSTVQQHLLGQAFLDNCYSEVVNPHGNLKAKCILHTVMQVTSANWRGIGKIPDSGFRMRKNLQVYDAHQRFTLPATVLHKRSGEMPAGCDCANVVLGKRKPDQCKLYGRTCTPQSPVGPCMVSEEGACHIWWNSGIRQALRQESAL